MGAGVAADRETDDRRAADFLGAARPFWHPIARSRDLPSGSVVAVTLLGEQLAAWRDDAGTVGLVDDCCVHRGTRLSIGAVSGGCIRCPYHGWEYDATGACSRLPQLPDGPIPPTASIRAYQVAEHAGLVWACLADPGDEARGIPRLDESEQPGIHTYVGLPFEWACQSGRQIENFCDIAHFSFIHVDVFGNPDVLEVPPHTVTRSSDGWQLGTSIEYPSVNSQAPVGPDGKHPILPTRFDYRVELPFAVHLGSTMGDAPYTLFVANQPIDADSCRVFWVMASRVEDELPDELVEGLEQVVFQADRAVVETQRPERLPIDLGAELHLPFDRMAVAYRRALAELGFP